MKSIFKAYRDDTKGNVTTMFVLSLATLGIGVGAAIDYSILTSKHQKLQAAVDAATLYATTRRYTDDFESDAQIFLSNSIADLNISGLTSKFEVQGSNIFGKASGDAELNFAGFLNRDASKLSASAIVTVPEPGRPCIVLLDETKNQSLNLNGGAHIDAGGCEVHVHSTANHAASASSSANLNSKRTCVAGGVNVNYGGSLGNLETECDVADDPFAGEIPVPSDLSCDYNSFHHNGGYLKLEPGVYCGNFFFQGGNVDVDMEAGLYVIKGGGWYFNSGTFTGHGVTLYLEQGAQMTYNSGIDINWSAPTDGDYANILIAENPSGSSGSIYQNLNDSNGYDFQGVIYLPSRHLTLNSGANVASQDLTIVAKSLTVNNVSLSADSFGDAEVTSVEVYISE